VGCKKFTFYFTFIIVLCDLYYEYSIYVTAWRRRLISHGDYRERRLLKHQTCMLVQFPAYSNFNNRSCEEL